MRHPWFVAVAVIGLPLVALAEPAPPPSPAPAAVTPLHVFRGIGEQPDAVAFSPDGKRLLSASGFELLLWEVPSAKPLRRLAIPNMFRDFTACAFSPDGKTVMAGSNDGKIATWDAASGRLGKVLKSEDWMYDCAFTTDGVRVLAVYQSGRVIYREMATGKVLWEMRHPGVHRCHLSADGRRAVTASEIGMAIRDAATGETLLEIPQAGSALYHKTVALSPDGSRLVCLTRNPPSGFVILDTRTGEVQRTFEGHTNSIRFLGFSPDGTQVVSASADNTLKLWNSATGELVRTFSGHQHDVVRAAFLPDGSKILSASEDLSMKLWDCRRETIPAAEHAAILAAQTRQAETDRADGYVEPLLTIAPGGHKFGIEDAAFSPDGNSVISCSSCNPVRIHDAFTGAVRLEYAGHPADAEALSCCFSPDGRSALTSGRDGTLKLWNVDTGETIRTFEGHDSYVPDAAFSPDGRRIVSVSWDKAVRTWDATTGKELLTLGGHAEDLQGCAFLPDGQSLLVTSSDQTVRIYQAGDGTLRRTLRPGYEVTAFAISPDGGRLFTGSGYEASQALWDLGSGKASRLQSPRNEYAHSAAFSPDGKWLVTGSLDHGIRIRDGATGALVVLVRSRAGHSDGVEAVSFSPDGKRVLTGSGDGSIKIWNFDRMLRDSRRQP